LLAKHDIAARSIRRLHHPFFKQGVICQNHFFKIQFSSVEKFEGTDVFLILWNSCRAFFVKYLHIFI